MNVILPAHPSGPGAAGAAIDNMGVLRVSQAAEESERGSRIGITGHGDPPRDADLDVGLRLHRYHFAAAVCAGRRVLDLGGAGAAGIEILSRAGATVITDRSGATNSGGAGLDSDIDVVICLESDVDMNGGDQLLAAASHTLRSGGVLLVAAAADTIAADMPGARMEPVSAPEESHRFRAMLARHFENVVVCVQTSNAASLISPSNAAGSRHIQLVELGAADHQPERSSSTPVGLLALASHTQLPEIPEVSVCIDPEFRALRRLQQQLDERSAHISSLQDQIGRLDAVIRGLVRNTEKQRKRLELIEGSVGWRALQGIRHVLFVEGPKGRRFSPGMHHKPRPRDSGRR